MPEDESELFDADPINDPTGGESTVASPKELHDVEATIRGERNIEDKLPIIWLLSQEGRVRVLDVALQDLYNGNTTEYESKRQMSMRLDISRKSLSYYLDEMAHYDIYKTRGNKRLKYCVNEDSEVLQAFMYLDQVLRNEGPPPDE